MQVFQFWCIAIVLLQVGLYLLRGVKAREFFKEYFFLVLLSWIAENSVIRLYHFYDYHEGWWFFIDHVPVIICLIWPLVILSAREIAFQVTREKWQSIATAIVVFFDASFIEPVATTSGLWSWHEPGLFSVPLIGIMGWAIFAGLCTRLQKMKYLAVIIIALHASLLLLWWGLFRYISFEFYQGLVVISAIFPVLASAAYLLKNSIAIESVSLLQRLPALFLFLFLLLRIENHMLYIYCLVIAVLYFVLLFSGIQKKKFQFGVSKQWM